VPARPGTVEDQAVMKHEPAGWAHSPTRAALLTLYAEVDRLLQDHRCSCSPALDPPTTPTTPSPCCRFGVTGREPYPTAVELREIRHAMRAAGIDLAPRRDAPRARGRHLRRLALLAPPDGACPLLSPEGRCRIYAARPLGCRTYFCDRPIPRAAVSAIGRRIGDLSERFAPEDPGPRPLVHALAAQGR